MTDCTWPEWWEIDKHANEGVYYSGSAGRECVTLGVGLLSQSRYPTYTCSLSTRCCWWLTQASLLVVMKRFAATAAGVTSCGCMYSAVLGEWVSEWVSRLMDELFGADSTPCSLLIHHAALVTDCTAAECTARRHDTFCLALHAASVHLSVCLPCTTPP